MTANPYLRATDSPKYSPRLTPAPEVFEASEHFHYLMVQAGGLETGALIVNSDYRPRGETCGSDTGGRIDLTDANGHWTGRAIDFSARRTAESFFGRGCSPYLRNKVRDTLYQAGFRFPWYYRRGKLHEFWHIALEIEPWRQKHAYRDCPPHWSY